MKTRIMIPAFFVIAAANEHEAKDRAADMMHAANSLAISYGHRHDALFLDEGLPNGIIRLAEHQENPSTMLGTINGLVYNF